MFLSSFYLYLYSVLPNEEGTRLTQKSVQRVVLVRLRLSYLGPGTLASWEC